MARTLEGIEQDIRENNLRGQFAIPPEVLAEHRNPLQAFETLERIDRELALAIAAENTARVRQLNAEKKRILAAQERETAQRLALINASRIPAPAKGEEARLSKRAKQIEDRIERADSRRKKLLDRLANDPENETILGKIEALKSGLSELESEQRETGARLEQIEQWREEKRKGDQLAAAQREWERKAPEYRAALSKAAAKVICAWKALAASMREVDELREKLRSPIQPAESQQTLAEIARIGEATNGAVQCGGGGQWTVRPNGEVRR